MFTTYDITKLMSVFFILIQPIADETEAFLHSKKLSLGDGDTYQRMPIKAAERDSYTNLYDADVPLGGSAHSLRNQLVEQVVPGSPRQQHISMKPVPYTPRTDGHVMALTSPERAAAPPPYDYVSSRSVRQVSPLVGSPPSLYRGQVLGATKGSGPTVLANDEKYPLMPVSQSSYSQPSSQASAGGSPLPTRTKAGGLLRYGSPTFPPPTARDSDRSAPLSVATSGLQSMPGAVRRPVSFVRALEMSDQLAGAPTGRPRPPQQQPARGVGLQPTAEEDERAYGSSYEIAV